MIVMYDKNYPLIVLKIYKFELMEYNTILKNLDYIQDRCLKDAIYCNLHIDLYDLVTYDNISIYKLITHLYKTSYSKINSLGIYINKNNSTYVRTTAHFINDHMNYATIPIKLVELDKKKKW